MQRASLVPREKRRMKIPSTPFLSFFFFYNNKNNENLFLLLLLLRENLFIIRMSDSERERKHGAQEELHVNEATWGLWIVREWSEWVSGGGSGEKRRWSSSATYPTWPLSLSLCVACACVWCVNVRVMSVSRCLSLSYSRFAFVFIQDSPRIRILLFHHNIFIKLKPHNPSLVM